MILASASEKACNIGPCVDPDVSTVTTISPIASLTAPGNIKPLPKKRRLGLDQLCSLVIVCVTYCFNSDCQSFVGLREAFSSPSIPPGIIPAARAASAACSATILQSSAVIGGGPGFPS